MTTELPHTMREMDSRTNDGLHIRLLWSSDDGRVAVAISDEKSGDRFAFDVRDGDRPLDAFRHPFSYMAWRGIDSGSPSSGAAAATASAEVVQGAL